MKQRIKKVLRDIQQTRFDFQWKRESYSQFGEDGILRSLIEHQLWQENASGKKQGPNTIQELNGFYVDIGAFAPKQFSNTYWFYKQGWKGINIDATPGSMVNFRASRKRDINLEYAVSDKEEILTYYTWNGGGAITNTFSSEQASEFAKIYNYEPTQVKLKTKTLAEILDKHLPANQSIDFLSLDVEGNNLKVLQSNNWSRYIPTYIIVELDGDEDSIEKIQSSQLYSFLLSKGYTLKGWTCLSLLFMKTE